MTASLAAVLAAHEDAAPRRAFAESVRSSDPARAELVDRQLELRELRRNGTTPDPALETAVRALVQRNGRAWAGPIAAMVDYFEFWGGFVEEIKLDATALLVSAGRLAKLAPIRHLSIRKLAGSAAAVAQLPILGQLASLDIGSSGISDSDLAALVASPRLAGLRLLRVLNNPNVTIAGLRAVGAANLPALRFVESSRTDAPLVVRSEDWDGTVTELAWTRVRTTLVAELGHRPWLDAQVEPSLDTL